MGAVGAPWLIIRRLAEPGIDLADSGRQEDSPMIELAALYGLAVLVCVVVFGLT